MAQSHIIIAGAGPVGVVSALALAQHGYAVTLLEADAVIDDNPRAATTHPSTLEMIARVGLIDQIITKQGEESLLDRYTHRRRTSNIKSVQEQATRTESV